jgi:hypothetical protein
VTGSTKHAAALSFGTQLSTKAINFGLSVAFVRLAPAGCLGYFTLLIAAAQLVCSLGRVGTNYSYAVLLPQQTDSTQRQRLTTTYSLFSLMSSVVVAAVALWQLAHAKGMPEVLQQQAWLISGLTLTYLLSDSLSETVWSIHLARGRFQMVFLRDVWLALGKGLLPLAGALWLGAAGVVGGLALLSLLNGWIALALLQRQQPCIGLPAVLGGWSWSLLLQLLKKGLPFFSVPLVTNLILWPLLMKVVNSAGINQLDGLRIAQICAQVIGILSASLMPVLLVQSSHQSKDAGRLMHQRAFQACWSLSLLIYCLYALSDTTILPLVFGQGAAGAISIARILVAAAAVQGLSQIPMQRPLATKALSQLSLLQIGSLVLAAIIAIETFQPADGLMAYASISLISPLITVLCLPAVLRERLVPEQNGFQPQLWLSFLLIATCFRPEPGPIQITLLLASVVVVVASNRQLLAVFQPKP